METFNIGTNSILAKDIEVYYKGKKLICVESINIYPEIAIKQLIEDLNGRNNS